MADNLDGDNARETEQGDRPPVLDASAIREAADRLRGVAHRTPIVQSRTLDAICGARLYLKAEIFQRSGSFKFRGAYNAIAALGEAERLRGVCTFSSGNHGQAVALAARLLGCRATVLMPQDAPVGKLRATEGYGARVIPFDRYTDDRTQLVADLAESEGLTAVPAFDDLNVMAGQGTAALELIQDAGHLDTLVVPMSGGGLMAGCGVSARDLLPDVDLVGVEPSSGDDTAQSLRAGERVRIPVPRTIADALQADSPGRLTFPINRVLVDAVLTVTDGQIKTAMRLLLERQKVVVEPGGAAALAAVLSNPHRFAGKRVGIILSGGNVSVDQLTALLSRTSEQQ